jgi:hypothetical protein
VQGAPPRTIVVYGFSILDDVMNRGIFPTFQKEWQALPRRAPGCNSCGPILRRRSRA